MYVCMYVFMYVCLYLCLSVCMSACLPVCIYVCHRCQGTALSRKIVAVLCFNVMKTFLRSNCSSTQEIQIYNNLIFGVWFKHIRWIILHAFDVGLLMRVCYPKRSSSPLSNFLSDLINDAHQFIIIIIADALKKQLKLSHPQKDMEFLYGTIITDGQDEHSSTTTSNVCVFAERQVNILGLRYNMLITCWNIIWAVTYHTRRTFIMNKIISDRSLNWRGRGCFGKQMPANNFNQNKSPAYALAKHISCKHVMPLKILLEKEVCRENKNSAVAWA